MLGCDTKTIIINEICKRFGSIEQVHSLGISILLDPRFKKIYFTNKITCSQAICKITSILSDIETETEQLSLDESANSHNNVENAKSTNIWKYHSTLVKEKYPEEQETNRNNVDFKNDLT